MRKKVHDFTTTTNPSYLAKNVLYPLEQYHYFSEKCVFGTFSVRFRIFDITLWLFSRNLIFDERKLFLILRKYVLNSFLYSYIKLDIKTEGS